MSIYTTGGKRKSSISGDLNIASTSLSWKGIKSEPMSKGLFWGKRHCCGGKGCIGGFIVGLGISNSLDVTSSEGSLHIGKGDLATGVQLSVGNLMGVL